MFKKIWIVLIIVMLLPTWAEAASRDGSSSYSAYCAAHSSDPLCANASIPENNPITEQCGPDGENCTVEKGRIEVVNKVDDLVTEEGIVELVLIWINWALGFLLIIAVIIVIYAGVLYISPKEEKKEKANKLIINTFIGILIIILSYAIVRFIFSFFIK